MLISIAGDVLWGGQTVEPCRGGLRPRCGHCSGGRLVAIADLRYRHRGTRTMILGTSCVAVAERTVRVYRPLV
ncbi:hypothetical protein Slala03_53790 [Streptomyces lavendulae subsp. lavendulae]|nr:hypothetical protein Slala03_53790 [Streptomyces lavendulae subsp. lavendulae]